MTTPIVTAPCEVCGAEPAAMSLMNLADYSAVKVGNACMPAFLASLATDLVMATAGGTGHTDMLDECEACTQLHDLVVAMTAAPEAAPGAAAEPAPEPAAEAAPEPAAEAARLDPADALPPVYEVDGGQAVPPPPAPVRRGPVREPSGPDTASDRERVSDLQRELLALAGVTGPDQASCPACETVCWTAPGAASYLCPWCGGRFNTAAAAGPGPLVIDGTDGTRGDAAPAAADLSDSPADAGVTPAI